MARFLNVLSILLRSVSKKTQAGLPIALLRDGNYNQDPETAVKAIMVGSMAEDSYTTVPSNCDFQTFKDTVYSQYLFEDYVGKNTSVWDRMVPLYNSTAAPHSDGPPPVGMNRWNRTWDHYYWALKHLLADAESFCPARAAARYMSAGRGGSRSDRSSRSSSSSSDGGGGSTGSAGTGSSSSSSSSANKVVARKQNMIQAYHFQFRHACETAQARDSTMVATAAQHSAELPFMFYKLFKNESNTGQYMSTAAEVELGAMFATYIRNFAATDNPTGQVPVTGRKVAPPPPASQCGRAMKIECGDVKAANGTAACLVCCGEHAFLLKKKRSGCTSSDFQTYCSTGPSPSPSPSPSPPAPPAPPTPPPTPPWPKYDRESQHTMILDTADQGGCHAVPQYRAEQCYFWDTVPDEYVPVL